MSRAEFFRSAWPWLKWVLFGLVLAFVGRHAARLWEEVGSASLRIRWSWLLLAGLSSIVAWLPSLWVWRRFLSALGSTPPWPQAARAYYCGHLGKYVPGKGLALVIRAALLKPCGVPVAASLLTVMLETLTYMAAGVIVAVCLVPTVLADLPQGSPLAGLAVLGELRIAFPLAALVGSVGGLWILSWMSGRLSHRLDGTLPGIAALARPVPWPTLATALVTFVGAWILQGLTLGLTLQAVSPEGVDWRDWPLWTGASAVSLVGGFLAVFAPGGLGVREGLLIELLRQQSGPQTAIAAAVLLRGVSLAGELVAAGTTYWLIRPAPSGGTTAADGRGSAS